MNEDSNLNDSTLLKYIKIDPKYRDETIANLKEWAGGVDQIWLRAINEIGENIDLLESEKKVKTKEDLYFLFEAPYPILVLKIPSGNFDINNIIRVVKKEQNIWSFEISDGNSILLLNNSSDLLNISKEYNNLIIINRDNLLGLENHIYIKSLIIANYKSDNLECLSKLKNLEHLRILHSKYIKNLKGLEDLTNLKYFYSIGCISLVNVDSLQKLSNLWELSLDRCKSIHDINSLRYLTNLIYLDLSECHNINDFSILAHLKELEELNLSYCNGFKNINILKNTKKLKKLNLSNCGLLTNNSSLINIKELKDLDLVITEKPTNPSGRRK